MMDGQFLAAHARARRIRMLGAAAVVSVSVAGCGTQMAAPIDFRGSHPDATTSSPTPTPDNRGVVKIDNYDAVVARQGDTLDSIAARLEISASELAAYNGYPAGFAPRPGDVLVLPPRPGGYGAVPETRVASAPSSAPASSAAPASAERWSPALAAAAIERGGEPAPSPTAVEAAPIAEESLDGGDSLFAPLAEPIEEPGVASGPTRYRPTGAETTHIATAGETTFSIANRYSVTVGELAYANGMNASDAISPGQVLIIPQLAGLSGAQPTETAAVSIPAETASPEIVIDESGAAQPAPAAVAAAAPADTGARFLTPVSGPIVEPYSAKRGGVEFGAAPGAPVRAADDGTVVLVSKSLGGLGVIILVRHDAEYMTVYGRVSDDAVSKGEKVRRGQVIASVAEPTAGAEPSLHFEIRRGTVSIDPEPLL